MPYGSPQNTTQGLNVPTYLPLSDAAKKFKLSEKALTQLIKASKIEAVQLPSGELLVAAEDNGKNGQNLKTKDEIIAEEFAHLRLKPITVTEAAENYDLHRDTVLEWTKKGYITSLKHSGRGSRMELDEADVAYCAKIYHERGGKRGVRLFDEDGDPYQLKHPQLSKHRREQQKK